jgi:hypothetical protein
LENVGIGCNRVDQRDGAAGDRIAGERTAGDGGARDRTAGDEATGDGTAGDEATGDGWLHLVQPKTHSP